jgi:peptidoglycan hydrolase-like protein with peptidoglycan-binding domain
MYKKLLITGLGVAALAFAAIPLVSSAQALTATATSASSPVAVSACAPFARSLSIGATGSDVTNLQSYLAAQGYLKVSPTGYFGVLTQAAVANWQASGSVAVKGSAGSGIFGPLSRAYFLRSCGGVTTINTPATSGFSASPQSGAAPLTVQFNSSEPQGSNVGNTVNFGDGTSGTLAFVPTCSNCNAIGIVSHTYTTSGTYTASLTSGNCACPAGGTCNCPMIQVLATTTVAVGPPVTATPNIQQVNAPASVALSAGGIAEVRNESYYFTLESLTSSSATIEPTPVICANHFPSDPPPEIYCLIAIMPIPPQTLSLGQSYVHGNFDIKLTQLTSGVATFSVGAPAAQ